MTFFSLVHGLPLKKKNVFPLQLFLDPSSPLPLSTSGSLSRSEFLLCARERVDERPMAACLQSSLCLWRNWQVWLLIRLIWTGFKEVLIVSGVSVCWFFFYVSPLNCRARLCRPKWSSVFWNSESAPVRSAASDSGVCPGDQQVLCLLPQEKIDSAFSTSSGFSAFSCIR